MKKILFFILVLMFSLSCEKDAFNSNYEFLYGEWTPTKIDTWFKSDLTSFGNNIQFIENHRYKIFRNDTLLEVGNIDITEQTETNLTIRFVAKVKDIYYPLEYKHINRSELIVTALTNDSIRMGNLATDGGYFGIWLSRKE